jgi:hypothetical protein
MSDSYNSAMKFDSQRVRRIDDFAVSTQVLSQSIQSCAK